MMAADPILTSHLLDHVKFMSIGKSLQQEEEGSKNINEMQAQQQLTDFGAFLQKKTLLMSALDLELRSSMNEALYIITWALQSQASLHSSDEISIAASYVSLSERFSISAMPCHSEICEEGLPCVLLLTAYVYVNYVLQNLIDHPHHA